MGYDLTTNYSFRKPILGTFRNEWPVIWRYGLDQIDTVMHTKFDKAGGTITGPVQAQGRVSSSHATANDNNAAFTNTSATGYGLFSRGGGGSYYAAFFADRDGVQLMSLSGTGAIVLGTTSPIASGKFSLLAPSTSNGFVSRIGDNDNYTFVGQNVAGDNTFFVTGAGRVTAYGVAGTRTFVANQEADAEGWSGANTAMWLARVAATGRSLNAGGTINASGADYAEYRKNNGLTIAKGQIVGYKADGTLTLTWSHAVLARVKSTDPCMVGGDAWGAHDKVGTRPEQPKFTPPEYIGRDKPADLAPEPLEPAALDLTEPVHPGANADAVAAAVYALAKRDYDAAIAAHAEALSQWAALHAAWEERANQYLVDLAAWESDQGEHAASVETARELFDTLTMPAYESELVGFEARLEQARQGVDRIAYSGIVPCNVLGATPGHYIVAAEGPGDTIIGVSVQRPTEEQWPWVVGRCISVLPDGRAEIDVMLS